MKKTLLLLFCFFVVKNKIHSQNNSCASAVELSYPNIDYSATLTHTNNELWYKVQLFQGEFVIALENITSSPKVTNSELYRGTCAGLELLRTDSLAKTDDMKFEIKISNSSTVTTTYYIKLNVTAPSGTPVSIKLATANTYVRIVGWFAVCPGATSSNWAIITNPNSASHTEYWGPPLNTNVSTVNFIPTSTGVYTYTYTDIGVTISKTFTVSILPSGSCVRCNYVRNPNFECINGYMFGYAQTKFEFNNGTADWYSANYASPDVYHTLFDTMVNVPQNNLSFNAPSVSGNGYAGLISQTTSTQVGSNYREYIENHLVSPLAPGQLYHLRFSARCSQRSQFASDKLGVALTNSFVSLTTDQNLTVTPVYESPNIINYSASWVTLSTTVTGSGQEYLTIGNFNTAANTTYTNNSSGSTYTNHPSSYFYIDDVILSPVDNTLTASSSTITACTSKSTLTLSSLGSYSLYTSWTNGVNTWTGSIVTIPNPSVTTTYTCNVVIPGMLNCMPSKTITVFVTPPYIVPSSTTWNIPLTILGPLVVQPGAVLTITGAGTKIRFADSQLTGIPTYVEVKPGGQLIIENGAELTSVDNTSCPGIGNRMWDGIAAMGTHSATQYASVSNYTYLPNQALVSLNSATISNARTAITTGTHTPSGSFKWSTTGAVITAINSSFINNGRDAQFVYYHDPILAHINNNKSYFINCKFLINNTLNNPAWPLMGRISLYEVLGVKIQSCEFKYNAGNSYAPLSRGYGILSYDAQYEVKDNSVQSKFTNLTSGIEAYNSNTARVVNVDHAIFTSTFSNVGSPTSSLRLSNVYNSFVKRNTFTLADANADGIYLNSCKYYSVNNNTITSSIAGNGAGMHLTHSKDGAHKAYRNNLGNLQAGILPQYQNADPANNGNNYQFSGLLMNCNTFTTLTNTNDIIMLGANTTGLDALVYKSQGLVVANDLKKRVRNQYAASCGSMNKWYVANSTKTILHAANSGNTLPIPQPSCSSNLLFISQGSALNFTLHCPENESTPTTTSCPSCNRIANINTSLGEAISETDTLTAYFNDKIDGGNTQYLLNAINSGTLGNNSLKDLLIGFGPYLSDTVLKTYFRKSSVTGVYAVLVHNVNKPVTSDVWTSIIGRGFTGAAMDSMTVRQAISQPSERETLEGFVSRSKFNLAFVYGEKLSYYLTDTLEGALDTVISLLSQNKGNLSDAPVRLIHAYAKGRYYTRAFAVADSLSSIPKYSELMVLEKTLLKLDTVQNKIFKITTDSDLNAVITAYAADSTKAGSWQARAVLRQVYGTDMNFIYLWPPSGDSRVLYSEEESNDLSNDVLTFSTGNESRSNKNLRIYPNPTSSSFNLLYKSKQGIHISYYLHDVLGNEMKTGRIEPNILLEINVDRLKNGIYFLTLVQDDKVIEKEKLIIMK